MGQAREHLKRVVGVRLSLVIHDVRNDSNISWQTAKEVRDEQVYVMRAKWTLNKGPREVSFLLASYINIAVYNLQRKGKNYTYIFFGSTRTALHTIHYFVT